MLEVYFGILFLGAVEVVGYFICMYVLIKLGRKWPMVVSMVVGGLACLVTLAFDKGNVSIQG